MADIFQNNDYLKNALDAANLRMEVISNNIANINTPGYTSQAVAFEDKLKQILSAQESEDYELVSFDEENSNQKSDLKNLNPEIYDEGEKPDINQQMANLAKSQIIYAALAQTYKKTNIDFLRIPMDGFQR